MRLLPSILTIAVLAACAPGAETPSHPSETPVPTAALPSPYPYPDLPGGIEDTIAEGDCDALDTVAAFMDRDSVDPIVRHQAMDAIAYRSEELDC